MIPSIQRYLDSRFQSQMKRRYQRNSSPLGATSLWSPRPRIGVPYRLPTGAVDPIDMGERNLFFLALDLAPDDSFVFSMHDSTFQSVAIDRGPDALHYEDLERIFDLLR
jgi:hypothetical protein